MFRYLQSKNLNIRGSAEKSKKERVCYPAQFAALMKAVERSAADFNKHWERDQALLYIAYNLGLRIGEAAMLEKTHFEKLERDDIIMIPTLKQSERILFQCSNPDCGRRCKVSTARLGDLFECPKCFSCSEVKSVKEIKPHEVPLKDIPFVEGQVSAFILSYLAKIPQDQKWLFPSSKKEKGHISSSFASRIFSTYAQMAGLPTCMSFHSLRHGRGMRIYSITDGDLVAVRDSLRQKDIKTAQIYSSLDQEKAASYKKKLEKGVYDPRKAVSN